MSDNTWIQLFVKSPNPQKFRGPEEMFEVDTYVSALAPATVVTDTLDRPIRNANYEWEIRLYDASFAPAIKKILAEKFDLHVSREVILEKGPYVALSADPITKGKEDFDGLVKYCEKHHKGKVYAVKMGNAVELTVMHGLATEMHQAARDLGFWIPSFRFLDLPDSVKEAQSVSE